MQDNSIRAKDGSKIVLKNCLIEKINNFSSSKKKAIKEKRVRKLKVKYERSIVARY